MNIAVGSAFRNSSGRLRGYFQQIKNLQQLNGRTRVIAAEGDSNDGTGILLASVAAQVGISADILECSHGGPSFGSTEAPERMKALSTVGNTILDGVRPDDDVLVYVESDLLWDANVILRLCQKVRTSEGDFDVIAPLIFAGELFYDVWAFRGLDGQRFSPFAPYHSQLGSSLTEVSSAGSCLVMKAEIAWSRARMTDGALVEWCTEARKLGYRIAVDPTLRIYHPA